VRSGFAHEATLRLAAGADERAVGAAVTVGLCGRWDHGGDCRWPHHTTVESRSGQVIRVRTVFACGRDDEAAVRRRIRTALETGRLDGPDGANCWTILGQGDATLRPAEEVLVDRWASG
jgi:phage-related baseplate assembly protein